MKIFIVCPKLNHGGAERVGVLLANGFLHKGHEVYVISNLYEYITYDLDSEITKLCLVKNTKHKFYKWISSVFLLRKYIKYYSPDVIIGIMSTCSLVSKIASVGLKVPIVATEHDSFERPQSAPFTFWQKFCKFQLNRLFKIITVLTEADKRVIGEKFHNVIVMPNPLAIEPMSSVPRKEKTILAVGRIDDWHSKGFDILIKAWGNIEKHFPDWRLQIAGVRISEKTRITLKIMEDKNHITNPIEYLGLVRDMAPIYQRSSIFVLSSRYEGFGLVLIEAMSQGCACVAADYNGRQSEIIKNSNQGITCETENVDALVQGIEKFILDENYRTIVQKNAIIRSEYYKLNNVISLWENLLKKIIK